MSILYTRPEARKRIIIPNNYGGNAFNPADPGDRIKEEVGIAPEEIAVSTADVEQHDEKPGYLPFGIGSEELLLLGILIILTQSDEGGDILPFLLILLFFKNGK